VLKWGNRPGREARNVVLLGGRRFLFRQSPGRWVIERCRQSSVVPGVPSHAKPIARQCLTSPSKSSSVWHYYHFCISISMAFSLSGRFCFTVFCTLAMHGRSYICLPTGYECAMLWEHSICLVNMIYVTALSAR
jgi:hypothetical protein